ncbi:MAG TPA: L-histidine N(alpha)-methyltransferase [Acidisarcina sp.]|nr:L-histidine N(alpha)-methyltransferase [Acidisarcina sp.]
MLHRNPIRRIQPNTMNALSSLSRLPEAIQTPLGAEVYRGLTKDRKSLSPWLFYDEEGSNLFERITELEEYYPTRTERAIFSQHGDAIVAAAAGEHRLHIMELGAGTASKTGILLEAAVRRQGSVLYEPIDVSASALEEATLRIEDRLPDVTVLPRVADYTEGLRASAQEDGHRRLVLYIGSSIGNFEPAGRLDLLKRVCEQLSEGDTLLLGVDLVKPESVLIPAYDDALGVTAEFNLNVLRRMNRELGANFDLDLFLHRAVWNRAESRIEMHLESTADQQVSIPGLGLEVDFRRGETIHTENSYKFTPAEVVDLLTCSGFYIEKSWFDPRRWFGVFLAAVP